MLRIPLSPLVPRGEREQIRCRRFPYFPRTLRSELNAKGHLPLAQCIDIGLTITSALAYLHQQGLVHRDVKPSNIILVNVAA